MQVRANYLLALLGMLGVVACGGGGSSLSGGGSSGGGTVSNVQSVTIDSGPSAIASSSTPAINTLYTTVTICVPGSTTSCQTIDHIQVDTGSSGLRILAQGTGFSLTLPAAADSAGDVLAECTQFVDGSSWGPIRLADVKIAGEVASSMEVQIIGDGAYPTVPSTCPGTAENTVTAFGANGILGVGPFVSDCGATCTGTNTVYYTCPTPTSCAASAVVESAQVSNPVASFTSGDNNGVIIELPTVAAGGVASVTGSLIFGIGTQSNNAMATGVQILTVDSNDGSLTTSYKGTSLTDSFIDSGSNGYFFPDSTITQCSDGSGFYCPTATLSESGIMMGVNGTSVSVSFSVVPENSYLNGTSIIAAAPGLAGSSTTDNTAGSFNGSTSFDWGLPFHFGRNVYTAIEGKTAAGVAGPYFAF
jgi:hypothetical protein